MLNFDQLIRTLLRALHNGENGQENWVLQANVPVELSRSTLANEAINKGLDWLRKNRSGKTWTVSAHTKYFALS